MAADSRLLEFIEAARARGASDQVLTDLLKYEGWPPAKVAEAFSAYYQNAIGMPVPAHRRSGASAKDAFLYLLAFATLGTWTIALGSLFFTLIDKWIPDRVVTPMVMNQNNDYALASALAAVLVAFPIYLFVMRLILVDAEAHPEKLESGVRKWLTYIALLIAAGVIIGDLVGFLTDLLRGEITARFVYHSLTVAVLATGVFWYYLVFLRDAAGGSTDAVE